MEISDDQKWMTEEELERLEYELAQQVTGRVLITGSLNLVHVNAMREYGEALLERGLQFDSAEGIRFDGQAMAPDLGLIITEFPRVDDVGRDAYLAFLDELDDAEIESREILYYDAMGFRSIR